MALDDFRRTDLIIDKATQRIDWQAPLRAVQGEYNGRSLRVQLTNNGIVEPQTAQLLFGFYCAVNHKEGVYDMTAVDLSKGIYEVFYPSDMLLEYGTVACTIKIIENAGSSENESHITILDGISVEVAENPISGQAEVAENSIRVFDKALIDISAHERRILLMELNFQELAQILTLNIPNMDVAVSTRAPADTALKNTVWTDARAMKLDLLNLIDSNLNRGMAKSVQRGEAVRASIRASSPKGSISTVVIPLSPVNPNKSFVIIRDLTKGYSTNISDWVLKAEYLTNNSLNFPFEKNFDNYVADFWVSCKWQVIEFY